MTSNWLGLIVGGLLPALLYGISSIFAKSSTNAGMSVGGHLFIIGIAISITGLLFNLLLPLHIPSLGAVASSSMQGVFWGLGTGCVVLGLINYQTPLAKLVPLYNMNTLVTSSLALIIFAEGATVNSLQLVMGAVLIVAGGILVSGA
ncbi:MAG: hypothetical protein AAF821_20100 [Cyanobacteria bacterium P01_D01_bin.156]